MSLPTDLRTSILGNLLPESNETTAASGVSKVEDTKDGKLSKPRTIVVFTPEGDPPMKEFADQLSNNVGQTGLSYEHVPVAAKTLVSKITELRASGAIGNDTQIFLYLHGVNPNNQELFLGEEESEQADTANAIEVLEAIRKPTAGSNEPCTATVYIASCGAGSRQFANRVQELHNTYKGGVCFLLSSKKSVFTLECETALKTVFEKFRAAKESDKESTNPEHLCAILSVEAADCISMVVANEAHPRRFHAARKMEDAGVSGLRSRIEKNAYSFRTDEDGVIPKTGKYEYNISATKQALIDYAEELAKIKEAQPHPTLHLRMAFKIARDSDCSHLSNLLKSSKYSKEFLYSEPILKEVELKESVVIL